MWKSLFLLVCGLVAVAGIPPSAIAQDQPAAFLPIPRSSLTAEEQARALALAKPEGQVASSFMQLDPQSAGAANRIVPSRVEAVVSDRADEQLAVVTYYFYQDDVTLNRLVDLKNGRVIDERREQGGSAPAADVEVDYARSLLMSDERIKRLLAQFEGQATFTLALNTMPDQANAFFGKRVMAALVRTPDGYISGLPSIFVNLTDGTVIVEP